MPATIRYLLRARLHTVVPRAQSSAVKQENRPNGPPPPVTTKPGGKGNPVNQKDAGTPTSQPKKKAPSSAPIPPANSSGVDRASAQAGSKDKGTNKSVHIAPKAPDQPAATKSNGNQNLSVSLKLASPSSKPQPTQPVKTPPKPSSKPTATKKQIHPPTPPTPPSKPIKNHSGSTNVTPKNTSIPDAKSVEFELLDKKVPNTLPHQVVTAPLITADAYQLGKDISKAIPQYGVIGSIISVHSHNAVETCGDRRLYLNTNAPFSAVVCGVQGSGKSHTVGVLLEAMMITGDSRLGKLNKSLSACILHYGEHGASHVCEAAYQCLPTDPQVQPPSVKVFVSPSQVTRMNKLYGSVFGGRVEVLPLRIAHSELDARAFLAMMCVDSDTAPPLYVQIVLSLLREMGDSFNYPTFKFLLEAKKQDFNSGQLAGLKQRMDILEGFLQYEPVTPRFKAGLVTIVDLTDPFIDSATACSIFEIVTRLFVRAETDTGKVLVLDEAHKYLTLAQGPQEFTRYITSIVRQQRHLGIRVVLSTQEPTVVPPVLLDLCTVAIMHRFSSISWFEHLAKHVSSEFSDDAFDAVVTLQTGQAIVLAPGGLGIFFRAGEKQKSKECESFGRRWLRVQTRQRVTKDGGASVLVV
ncbi:hypothetical protein FRB94_004903 [Tulasnella sp. JGI-2019a]|nr:hypothetical protein FRB93_006555 [Tulasnella sp. JGI-2019a]KAG9001203.1 hypothetical protein FRB94_004903 [Tulasnella sp. JGI-2019a]KAG9029925.1 hypothetical protein FRB95_004721 [Tulasnella sp. JGI-2019a]